MQVIIYSLLELAFQEVRHNYSVRWQDFEVPYLFDTQENLYHLTIQSIQP